MAYMMVISGGIGLSAGLAAGQVAKKYARNKGWSQDTQDMLAQVAHWAASSLAGSAASNIIDPITTVAHPMTTAVLSAYYHKELIDFMQGMGRLPSTR